MRSGDLFALMFLPATLFSGKAGGGKGMVGSGINSCQPPDIATDWDIKSKKEAAFKALHTLIFRSKGRRGFAEY